MMSGILSLFRLTTLADRAIIFCCSLLAGATLLIPFAASSGTEIQVTINDNEVYHGPLFQEHVLRLHGKSGPVVVETGERGVRVRESGCPNQICVRQGWRQRSGDLIVCVPNQLIIRILNGAEGRPGTLDATTR